MTSGTYQELSQVSFISAGTLLNPLGNLQIFYGPYKATDVQAMHLVWFSPHIRDAFGAACFHRIFSALVGDCIASLLQSTGSIPIELDGNNHIVARVEYTLAGTLLRDGIISTDSEVELTATGAKGYIGIINTVNVTDISRRHFPLKVDKQGLEALQSTIQTSFKTLIAGLFTLSVSQVK